MISIAKPPGINPFWRAYRWVY